MMFSKKKLVVACAFAVAGSLAFAADAQPGDDWLHVEGNQIVDADGNSVWLTGANWFGFNCTERVLHGLWSVNLEESLQEIADRGINILRIPISTELIYEWKNGTDFYPSINGAVNPDLDGATSLEVFDAMLDYSRQIGLKILLDVHSAQADNSGHFEELWYDDEFTSDDFYDTWEWITARYADDDTIIAMDLENEPHGKPWTDDGWAKWDESTDENNWKYACETAANRVLDQNPNMLVMCEGIESFPTDGVTWSTDSEDGYYNNWWGGNLRGVATLPVELENDAYQAQFMYSPHDYGPSVYKQSWFYDGFDKDTLYDDVWHDNWLYIHEEGISPLLIGEWGGYMDDEDNLAWMYALRDTIIEYGLHHTFWCMNPNSGDTGGLWNYDWSTWDEDKYELLKSALWQDDDGMFVSLDHEVALGSSDTGVSLNEYLAAQSTSISISSPDNNDEVLAGEAFTISFSTTKAAGVNVYVEGVYTATETDASSVTVAAPSSEGAFTVTLETIDSDGNELDVAASLTLESVYALTAYPEISISSPSASDEIETGAEFEISVALENATGFEYQLDGISAVVSNSTSATVTAPSVAGTYTLEVTALDDTDEALDATDSVELNVVEPYVTSFSCSIDSENIWDSGFVVQVTVTNDSAEAVSSWGVEIELGDGMSYSSGWNASFEDGGSTLTVSNLTYNGSLAAGASASFGLQGAYSSAYVSPVCTGL
ncbi:cellulase family glycosylhydrolase [Reinekea marinisedimentorum]|uniref:cellulase n=1 Tax=Reinekea marinisedimentorum TaxID=230495 RepID=A0A4R3I7K9_9GAMM|nr:cellulase family glycosylhydrolase [Reinekea marinisedimentorum]TCS41770.1 aryl-phospho-beta-D-glucosidase BglC (GH1 family) [Reinekea marinisedimentorum]